MRPGEDVESDFVPVFSVQLQSFIKLFLLILCPGFSFGSTFDNFLDFWINYYTVATDIVKSHLYLFDCFSRDLFMDLVLVYAV